MPPRATPPRAGALALAALLAAAPAPACADDPGRPLAFTVIRGDSAIGTHRVTFAREGRDEVVEAVTEIAVKIAFVTAYRYTQTVRQVWRGDRLQALDSRTDDNGTVRTVTARAGAQGLAVDGPNGRLTLAADTVPTGFWNRRMVGPSRLLDSANGKVIAVAAAPAGERTVEVGGRPVQARLHRLSGDIDAEIGYSAEGEWVSLVLTTRGNTITYARAADAKP